MKKALMLTLMVALAVSLFAHGHGWRGRHGGCYGEWAVPQENIPQAAQDFIGEYFPEKTVQFAGGNARVLKVALSDGTEIAFAPDGSWHDIKAYAGVPAGVLPQGIASSVLELYPNVPVMRAEKKWHGYELKLGNRMEMYFDFDGRLLGQKWDD